MLHLEPQPNDALEIIAGQMLGAAVKCLKRKQMREAAGKSGLKARAQKPVKGARLPCTTTLRSSRALKQVPNEVNNTLASTPPRHKPSRAHKATGIKQLSQRNGCKHDALVHKSVRRQSWRVLSSSYTQLSLKHQSFN